MYILHLLNCCQIILRDTLAFSSKRMVRERIHYKDITITPTLPTELEGLDKEEKSYFWIQVPRVGSHKIAEVKQEKAEAGIGTRTLPPNLLLCKPIGNELSVTGGMQVEPG